MSIDSMLSVMRADSFEIIDLDNVRPSSKLPRISKSVQDFTSVGKITRKRAILETERRYCENSGEIITDASTIMPDREKIAILLDPCT